MAGLVSVVPAGILRLLNWRQLEEKVCGVQSIDLAILECNTEYDDGIGPDDEHIKFFWYAACFNVFRHTPLGKLYERLVMKSDRCFYALFGHVHGYHSPQI